MALRDVLDAQRDPALLISRRALPEAQALWDGPVIRSISVDAMLAWHGGELDPETGATGLVLRGGEHEDLIGELVRFTRRLPLGDRSVIVYITGSADRETDFSISRRSFLKLGHLAHESISVEVEVVEPSG